MKEIRTLAARALLKAVDWLLGGPETVENAREHTQTPIQHLDVGVHSFENEDGTYTHLIECSECGPVHSINDGTVADGRVAGHQHVQDVHMGQS